MNTLSQQEAIERLRLFNDHPRFCRETLSIRDKSGTVVPLNLSPIGLKICKAVDKQKAAGRPVRVFIGPKPRQAFVSTTVASLIYKAVAYLPGQHAMVFGDLYKTAKNLYDYYSQFAKGANTYKGMPRPRIKRSLQDKKIEWIGDSWVEFQSAESLTSGRSFSVRHAHFSEYAFYARAGELMTGIMNSIPPDPFTNVFVESTAFGMGGDFYDMWRRVSDPLNGDDWEVVFSEWYEHPEYTLRIDGDIRRFQDSLNVEERLLHQLGVKLEQLNWRRWKIRTELEGDDRRFHQEFPSTPEEAFLTTGRTRFDLAALGRMPVIREWLSGDLERIRVGTVEQIHFAPRADGRGALQILRRPLRGEAYVIGADTAQGIDASRSRSTSDPDYSAASVLNQATGEQVAVLRERMTPATFGQYVVDLALWFNGAFIVPEATGIGVATIEAIMGRQYPIERIFWRQRISTDQRPSKLEDLGYFTNETTKPQLISALDAAVQNGAVILRHPQTIQEMRTYVIDARGRTNAAAGSHDDLVIAAALAVIGIRVAPLQKPPKPAEAVANYERRTVQYQTGRRR